MKAAVIRSVARAMDVVKEMNVSSADEWADEYRAVGRSAIAGFLKDRMKESISDYLARRAEGSPDRKNGGYTRRLLTEMGDVLLTIPRTRKYIPLRIIKAYARRCGQVDRLIMACFLLGLSTRKVGHALLTILGETISPATVSRVAKTLDTAVQAFHKRKLSNIYRALIFDGVVLARKTGMGALRRPVLVVLGIRQDGKKEVIDFRLATSESAAEWERFLNDLHRRGLTGENAEAICVDGGAGLLSVLHDNYASIPIQRCWAHKMRNVMDKVRKKDQEKVKRGLRRIYRAENLVEARKEAGAWKEKWERTYPSAVNCLLADIDDLFTCFQFRDLSFRKSIRTTNLIERRFREVRRRTRPMGVFSDKASIERILYAVFMYENKTEEAYPVFLMTQKS